MLVLSKSIPYADLGLTIYRDDALKYKFYGFPEAPHVRTNEKGQPVFLLIKYAFSDADREANPDLPMGGGYITLDTVFGMTEEQEKEALARLQTMLEDEWNKSRNLNPEDTDYTYKGPNAEFGTPQWVDGAVNFQVINDANLVQGALSEGKPSLFGSNNAIFNATLTPAGATFFEKTLTNDDGSGIDLTPIQVTYDLTFMRRLPPATIRIWANVTEVYHAMSELDHEHDENGWSEDDFSTNETYTETLVKSEFIHIDFDRGEYEEDDVKELESFAMGTVQGWLQENLFDRITPQDVGYPDVEDIYGKEADVYRLKKIDQITSNNLNLKITTTGLTPMTLHPQATLESFFGDMTPEEIAEHVREVDLEDDFFKTLDLSVKAYADFSEVQYVKVDVEYDGEGGLKNESFTFKSDDDVAGYWNPRLNNASREYRWRYEVGFKSQPDATIIKDWEPETTRSLNINVGRPGELNVDVLAGQIDWDNTVEQVQVTVKYSDRRNDIDEESATIILTKESPSGNYSRWLYKEVEKPIDYQVKYFLKNGIEVEGESEQTTGREIVVNDSFVDLLDVLIVAAGRIDSVNQVVVDCRYNDEANDFTSIKHFSISKQDFLGSWKVPLIDPDRREWEWKKLVLYKDGTKAESSWQQLDGSQTLAVSWDSPPSLDVSVNPALVKFDRAPVVEVSLTYKGNVVEGESPATFIFEEKKKQTWSLRIEDEDVREYDWEVTYYLADGDPIVSSGTSDKSTFLIPRTPSA